ncbi:MAG: calcium/sodium antiporter [Gammaproteobacteria bacterium]|nr:calcium/sodium antiporter [Gammaproteobacteria bacterium]
MFGSQLPLLLIVLIASLGLLAWSADRFIDAAATAAGRLGVSSLLIGIFVIGIGTSLPEMMVSALAAYEGSPGIALGNALGSNIANIGLILGITCIIAPILLPQGIIAREYRLLLFVTAGVALLMVNQHFSRLDGAVLLIGMIGVLIWLFIEAKRGGADIVREAQPETSEAAGQPMRTLLLWLVGGLILLLVSSQGLVWSASGLARLIGVSELVIGLSIVAIGTSLPELAAGIASVRRGHNNLAIGNIIGSCIFNLLGVLGIAALIQPFSFSGVSLIRDYGIMVVFFLAVLLLGGRFGQRGQLGRADAVVLLVGYVVYQALLFLVGE